ncbi:hypothetical protein C8R45DRAFT_933834 [Mycena sanguinolenta]|nr:hypothetical protein C8R45DRAFT_933834 [Mycena sanguinolenta]
MTDDVYPITFNLSRQVRNSESENENEMETKTKTKTKKAGNPEFNSHSFESENVKSTINRSGAVEVHDDFHEIQIRASIQPCETRIPRVGLRFNQKSLCQCALKFSLNDEKKKSMMVPGVISGTVSFQGMQKFEGETAQTAGDIFRRSQLNFRSTPVPAQRASTYSPRKRLRAKAESDVQNWQQKRLRCQQKKPRNPSIVSRGLSRKIEFEAGWASLSREDWQALQQESTQESQENQSPARRERVRVNAGTEVGGVFGATAKDSDIQSDAAKKTGNHPTAFLFFSRHGDLVPEPLIIPLEVRSRQGPMGRLLSEPVLRAELNFCPNWI